MQAIAARAFAHIGPERVRLISNSSAADIAAKQIERRDQMNAFSKKTLTAALGAVALAGAIAATAAPAEARSYRGAGWVAGGLAAGLVGAAIVSNAYAAPSYEYAPTCWREKQPIHNRFGEFVGYRSVRVCN
jgi:hypothetical protein